MKSCNDDNIDSMLVYIYTLHTLAMNYKIKLLVYQQVVRNYNYNLFTTSQGNYRDGESITYQKNSAVMRAKTN